MTESKNSENIESLLSLSQLLEAVNGSLLTVAFDEKSFCFTSVQTDSRNVVEKTLFVPLIGEFQDGHSYVLQSVQKGASVVFIAKSSYEKNVADLKNVVSKFTNVAFILVENTLHALQKAAGAYVRKFPGLIRVSVTGSSGKTTTKEIAASILRQKFSVISNVGNLNSETGLPLSVFNIRKEHELGLFEMGMNRENEIGEIADVFRPNYGIITNIGTAHIGILGSRQKIAEEKKKIFNYLQSDGVACIPNADDYVNFLEEGLKGKVVRYGFNNYTPVVFISDDGLNGSTFSVDGVVCHLALPGKYNFINAVGAVALAIELGVTPEQIKMGIESLKPLGGRSTLKKGRLSILEDCYNANPDSMEKSLDFCSNVTISGKKIFVLGDMLELGEESEKAHREVGLLAGKSDADMIVFVGKEMGFAYEEAKKISSNPATRMIHIEEKDDESVAFAASEINKFAVDGDFVLLKGSNGIKLGRFIPLLESGVVK